jgi:hypothetical protein
MLDNLPADLIQLIASKLSYLDIYNLLLINKQTNILVQSIIGDIIPEPIKFRSRKQYDIFCSVFKNPRFVLNFYSITSKTGNYDMEFDMINMIHMPHIYEITFPMSFSLPIYRKIDLSKFSSDLTILDMSRLKKLNLSYLGITTYERFANIYRLNLSYSGISDISVLTNCVELILTNCDKIISIPLMPKILKIDLSHCINLSDINGLINAKDVNLSYCKNILNLDGLANVKNLNISHTNISDLGSLTNVECLNITGCRNIKRTKLSKYKKQLINLC